MKQEVESEESNLKENKEQEITELKDSYKTDLSDEEKKIRWDICKMLHVVHVV